MIVVRAFLLWSAIIPLAIANGALRDAVLTKLVGAAPARLFSGLMLSAIIFGWTVLTISWIRAPQLWIYVVIGVCWFMLTVAFEFTFGRFVAKHSWDELLRAYRFEGGDIWPIVLVVVAISPIVAVMLRRHE
jgi:hypothetical protein